MKCPINCRNYYASVCLTHNRHSHEDSGSAATLTEVISIIPVFSSNDSAPSHDSSSYNGSSSSDSGGYDGGGGDFGGGGSSGDW